MVSLVVPAFACRLCPSFHSAEHGSSSAAGGGEPAGATAGLCRGPVGACTARRARRHARTPLRLPASGLPHHPPSFQSRTRTRVHKHVHIRTSMHTIKMQGQQKDKQRARKNVDARCSNGDVCPLRVDGDLITPWGAGAGDGSGGPGPGPVGRGQPGGGGGGVALRRRRVARRPPLRRRCPPPAPPPPLRPGARVGGPGSVLKVHAVCKRRSPDCLRAKGLRG